MWIVVRCALCETVIDRNRADEDVDVERRRALIENHLATCQSIQGHLATCAGRDKS